MSLFSWLQIWLDRPSTDKPHHTFVTKCMEFCYHETYYISVNAQALHRGPFIWSHACGRVLSHFMVHSLCWNLFFYPYPFFLIWVHKHTVIGDISLPKYTDGTHYLLQQHPSGSHIYDSICHGLSIKSWQWHPRDIFIYFFARLYQVKKIHESILRVRQHHRSEWITKIKCIWHSQRDS
jgi:hypothetical protein